MACVHCCSRTDLSFSGQGILRAVGVGGGVAAAGVVETSDLLDLWKQVTEHLGFVYA